jgi:hypothetical protein
VIRILLFLALALFVTWCSTTVKFGEYTCAGHIRRIWSSDETKDLRDGVKEKATSKGTKEAVKDLKDSAGPMVDRVKRGVKAGVNEAGHSDTAERAQEAGTDAAKDTARDTASHELDKARGQ